MRLEVIIIYILSTVYGRNANDYDENAALTALYFSYGAYCSSEVLERWECKYCDLLPHFTTDQVFSSSVGDLQGFSGYDSQTKQIVVSFRGTQSNDLKTVFLDFDWAQMYFKDGEKYHTGGGDWAIHEGFYKGLKALFEDGLYESLQNLYAAHPKSEVLLTGHSMGGALAQMLALMFVSVPLFESFSFGHVNIISFGAPRWGSGDISEYFNSLPHTNWRVVNKFDVIPTLPTKSTADYGYYHTRREVEYTQFGTLDWQLCDGDGEQVTSTNCKYTASMNLKYHVTYLNVYEDRCGEKPPKYAENMERNDEKASVSHSEWIVISLVCVGCLLAIILCCYFGAKVYQKSKLKEEKDKEEVAYVKIEDI